MIKQLVLITSREITFLLLKYDSAQRDDDEIEKCHSINVKTDLQCVHVTDAS